MHVAAEPGRAAIRQHLDDAAEGVRVGVGCVDLGDHPHAGRLVGTADRVRIHRRQRRRGGHPRGHLDRADRDDVRDHLDAVCLPQQRLGRGAERDPRGGLPGAGALQHGPGVVEPVLLHAGEIGVAGPGPGQRGCAAQARQRRRIDRVGRHDPLPLGPLGVADDHADRAAESDAVADSAEQLDLVTLEAHPRAATVPEPAAGQLGGDVGTGYPDPGGQPLDRRHQGGTMRLPRRQPTHHGSSLSRSPPRSRPRSGRTTGIKRNYQD